MNYDKPIFYTTRGVSTVMSEVKVVDRGSDPRTIPTDVALADEARTEIAPLLDQVCVILNRLRKYGLIAGFNCNMDQYGVHRPGRLDVTRPL